MDSSPDSRAFSQRCNLVCKSLSADRTTSCSGEGLSFDFIALSITRWRLWAAPTYTYYHDDYFGVSRPRKVLVFSGWRFVPKTVAIVASQVAAGRLGGDSEETSQPLRFTEKWSFHV